MFTSVIVLIISLTGITYAQTPAWSHHDEGAWPGKCNNGLEQSPIDIRPLETYPDPHETHIRGDLVYRGYSNVLVTARNTGYKVRWATVPDTPAPVLSGGPLRANYSFAEIHFHWLSEHAFNGIKYPLEIHLVHVKSGLTFAEGLEQRDGIAVIGVLAQVGPNGNNQVLDDLIPAVDYILEKSAKESSQFNIDLTHLFSPDPQAFYTYHGSLTTPLCPEVVTWIVMDRPTVVSHEQYKNLTRADLSGINNDRAVQPLGRRMVYRSKSVASCSHLATPSLLGSLAALMGCFGNKVTATLFGGLNKLVDAKKRFFGKHKQYD